MRVAFALWYTIIRIVDMEKRNFLMEKIVQIVISEDSSGPLDNQPAMLLNPLLTISVLGVPTKFSFSITIMCTGIDFRQVKTVNILLINHGAEKEENRVTVLGELDNFGDISFPDTPNNSFNLNMRNFALLNEGLYTVDFILDGETYSQNFNVIVE